MKVIKPGKRPDDQVYTANCVYCGCVYQFERREAQFESTCRNEDYLKTNCPTCKREVWVQI